jgi:hypothetical protein
MSGNSSSDQPRAKPSSSKDMTGNFAEFTDFMRRLVAVPHSEIKAQLDAEKRAKKRKKAKTSAYLDSGAKA